MTDSYLTTKLVLDTRDATKYDTDEVDTTRVKWNINPMLNGVDFGRIRWIQINAVEMPNVFYNIITGGNTLALDVYDVTGTTYVRTDTVSLTEGNYTITTLLSELETALNALGGDTYTVTKADNSELVSITNTNVGGARIKFNASVSTLDRILGFVVDTGVIASTLTGDSIYDLRGLSHILIKSNIGDSNLIRYSGGDTGVSNGLTLKLPLTEGFGSTVYWQNLNPSDRHYINWLPHTVEMELRSRSDVIASESTFNWSIEILVGYTE